jgi:hypothetical protein
METRMSEKIEWCQEFRGTYRACAGAKAVAVVQGSSVQGWRYSLEPGHWSYFYASAKAAKIAAEKAVRIQSFSQSGSPQ